MFQVQEMTKHNKKVRNQYRPANHSLNLRSQVFQRSAEHIATSLGHNHKLSLKDINQFLLHQDDYTES